jgi:hypothetical protein
MSNLTLKGTSNVFQNVLAQKRAERDQRGRLVVGIDATMSRQPAWDLASKLQSEMLIATRNLWVQGAYFRGVDEFEAFDWVDNGLILARLMSAVSCRGGNTQIPRMLRHVLDEHKRQALQGFVYVGDCFEHRRSELTSLTTEMCQAKIRAFIFHEGMEDREDFTWLAEQTDGFVAPFDRSAVDRIKQMFGQIAQLAIGRAKIDDVKRLAASQLRLTHKGS